MPYNPNEIWGGKNGMNGQPADLPQPSAPEAEREAEIFAAVNAPKDASVVAVPVVGGMPEEPPSFFRRHGLVLFTIGIFLLIGIAGIIYYLLLPPPVPDVAITFSNPGSVTLGLPFPLSITVANESKKNLMGGELSVTLPKGVAFAATGTPPDQNALVIPFETIAAQAVESPQTIELIATSSPGIAGTAQTVAAAFAYETTSTGATQYTADANAALTIGTQAALSLSYSAPSSIFSGTNFALGVNYANNTTQTLQGVELVMQYPPAYQFASSGPMPPADVNNTIWNIGTLAPNATGTIIIMGDIPGPAQAQYQLNGTIGASFGGQNYPAFTGPANFVITPLPLSLVITLNNSSTYVAGLADNLTYILTYTNNSNVTFQALSVSATLAGQMYDLTTLATNGSFNSKNDTITWYTANTPGLASLAPGQSGLVTFTVNTKKAFPSGGSDYTLAVSAEVQSPTVPPDTQGSSTVSLASMTSQVGGEVALTGAGYAKETAVSSITNTGPYPPKVNQPTTYTIHWNIVNYSTEINNVTVSAYLQSGTTFTGLATSTISSSSITYNAGTGLVTWTVPSIPAGAGVAGAAPAEAVFQVSNTPAVNQINQPVTLVGATTLTGTDAFTGAAINESAQSITTLFPDDPSASGQSGDVTQ
jgi:hypothetical protein